MNSSKISDSDPIHSWECGWHEHEHMQLQRLASLPLAEKLEWLEEAHRLVLHLANAQGQSAPHPND